MWRKPGRYYLITNVVVYDIFDVGYISLAGNHKFTFYFAANGWNLWRKPGRSPCYHSLRIIVNVDAAHISVLVHPKLYKAPLFCVKALTFIFFSLSIELQICV